MSKATDTLRFLAIHNSWRRGDETFGMQDPTEIGAAIDDAVNLLRRYDELERENADLRDTLDVVIAADERAVNLWRAAHPGKELVIPDRTELVGWLLEQNAALRAHAERVGQANNQLVVENAALRADKERLDWLLIKLSQQPAPYEWQLYHWTPEQIRAAIDAARKDAQP